MSKIIARTTKMTVLPEGEPLYSEQATTIEIIDDPAGPFLAIHQDFDDPAYSGKTIITPEDWPTIRATIETMLKEIQDNEPKANH